MKIAIIDIGSNTCRLAVFGVGADGAEIVARERNDITRLGEGLLATGALSADSMSRTLGVLKEYAAECEDCAVDIISAVGTQAIRIASNGSEFIGAAKKIGIEVQLITGEKEGELAFKGVRSGMDPGASRLVTIDVGGGSVELSYGATQMEGAESFPVGCVVMKDKFFHHDPPLPGEVAALRSHCVEMFSGVAEKAAAGSAFCAGVAGTITTIAMIDLGLKSYDSEKVHGHKMSLASISAIAEKLLAMDSAQRLKIPGMQPGRADIIHAGAVITETAVATLGADGLTASERDIRHGALVEALENLKNDI